MQRRPFLPARDRRTCAGDAGEKRARILGRGCAPAAHLAHGGRYELAGNADCGQQLRELALRARPRQVLLRQDPCAERLRLLVFTAGKSTAFQPHMPLLHILQQAPSTVSVKKLMRAYSVIASLYVTLAVFSKSSSALSFRWLLELDFFTLLMPHCAGARWVALMPRHRPEVQFK